MPDRLPLPDLPPECDGPLLAGFSGGLDSTVLLHRLAAEPALRARGLRAVHVHHGLQPQADAWAAHCLEVAAALGVPCEVRRVAPALDAGLGLEAAAREARYAALAAALPRGGVLATAHHQDDQAETFLLRALRASGPEGLGAMRPLRRFGGGWHWRPLLQLPRQALEAYARAHGLGWIDDPSNALAEAERNFLRLEVLPLLRRRWPHAAAALARSATLSAEADALLRADDAALLDQLAGDDGQVLPVEPLQALPAARRARLLRAWIRGLGLPPLPARGVERIERELLPARPDAGARFAWSGARVLRWRGLLHADVERAPLPAHWQAGWDGRAPLELPDGGRLWLADATGQPAQAAFAAPLLARARRGGERIRLRGRAHSHALKHLLQERGVPPWRRAQLPLLCDAGGSVLAAADIVLAAPLEQWLEAHALVLRWQPPRAPR
ncbi:tRNA lysidine(34) synthetase TilS [Pseudoxanthomonas sp. SGD-10]|nr:tRNA lysidine(34) synthetase TilS [Pseudoxanthomonas sp. SGT-18]RRN79630.1 tRNA lysidine(34) synthetase TilS [Pseudoxanthomonas sp. SGD-10]